jgi:hypothetical protein
LVHRMGFTAEKRYFAVTEMCNYEKGLKLSE